MCVCACFKEQLSIQKASYLAQNMEETTGSSEQTEVSIWWIACYYACLEIALWVTQSNQVNCYIATNQSMQYIHKIRKLIKGRRGKTNTDRYKKCWNFSYVKTWKTAVTGVKTDICLCCGFNKCDCFLELPTVWVTSMIFPITGGVLSI